MRYLLRERSPWKLIERVDAHPKEVIEVLKEFQSNGIVEFREGEVILTEKGKKLAEEMRVRYYDVRCPSCNGRGYKVDAFGILDEFKEITKARPRPTADYDQGYIREEDLMQRVAFIYERGDVEGSRIAVIGDDDLISIALALTGMPESITVLEIDDRLINFINKVAEERNLPISAHKFDVRHDVPEAFRGKHDIFITDPVETLPGITLFLSRAADTIVPHGAGYFGLTHIEASLKKWAEIERLLLDMNFVITDMLRDFNVYPMKDNLEISESDYIITREIGELTGAKKIDADFYRSTLIRIEALGEPKPKVRGDYELKHEVYVDDESIVTAMASRVL